MLSSEPQQQQQPAAVVAPPASQAAKTPDQAAVRQNNSMNIPTSPDTSTGTLLTGPGGVDNSTLKLGKNTALGA